MPGDRKAQIALQAALGLAANGTVADSAADRAEVLPALCGVEEAFFRAFAVTEALDPSDGRVRGLGFTKDFTDVAAWRPEARALITVLVP